MEINLSEQYRKEITDYLNQENRPFAVGFQLMQKYSIKIALLHMIGRKATHPNMHKKMDYELQRIAERAIVKLSPYANKASMSKAHPAIASLVNVQSREDEVLENISEEDKTKAEIKLKERLKVVTSKLELTPEEMPQAIKELYNKARKYYHLKVHYFTLMKAIPQGDAHNSKRAEALKLAKEYEDLSKGAWAEIDNWAKAGKPNLDEAKDENEPSTAEVSRAIGSSKSYISRYADSLDELTGKKYEARKEKLSEELKILLDNDIAIPAKKLDVLTKHGLIEQ